MIAIDTNVLVYAVSRGAPHAAIARALLASFAEGPEPWAVPWPCLYEFMRVVTHARVLDRPLPLRDALGEVEKIIASPSLQLLSETAGHASLMLQTIKTSGATGNLIHDAHIWTLCLEHGVSEFISADHDFLRFRGIRLTNPFAGL